MYIKEIKQVFAMNHDLFNKQKIIEIYAYSFSIFYLKYKFWGKWENFEFMKKIFESLIWYFFNLISENHSLKRTRESLE